MNIEFGTWAVVVKLLTVIIHIVLAYGVYHEAENIKSRGGHLMFLGSFLWFAITALSGLPAAAFFWIVHCSSLKLKAENKKV